MDILLIAALVVAVCGVLLSGDAGRHPQPLTILIAQEPISDGAGCLPMVLLAVITAIVLLGAL